MRTRTLRASIVAAVLLVVAPYLREGLAEVRTFASVFRAPETTFDTLEHVRTHAQLDAPPVAR